MDINLVDFYYEKFFFYAIKCGCHKSLIDNKNDIIKLIDKIVSNNNDYLLTESFISYIVDINFLDNLSILANNDIYSKFELIGSYYQRLLAYFNYSSKTNETKEVENSLTTYLNNNTKNALIYANYLLSKLGGYSCDLQSYDYALMELILINVLAFCHIDNCMEEFPQLIKYYDDIDKSIDDIIINGIDLFENDNLLIERIINKVLDKNKRIIN